MPVFSPATDLGLVLTASKVRFWPDCAPWLLILFTRQPGSGVCSPDCDHERGFERLLIWLFDEYTFKTERRLTAESDVQALSAKTTSSLSKECRTTSQVRNAWRMFGMRRASLILAFFSSHMMR